MTDATIGGQVTDPQGKVVPGVTVVFTNINTGVPYTTQTNGAGIYILPTLQPGIYRANVTKDGFKNIVKSNIEVHVQDQVSINFVLVLGSVSETVTVLGGAPLVNTQTGTISNVTLPTQLQEMPLITRQRGDQGLYGYELYNPGVSNTLCAGCGIAANGDRSAGYHQQATVDGITVMSGMDGVGGSTVQTGLEATGEVSVQLANAPPEFSQPVQMTMVSKGGTNQFHGSAFEDYNGNALNTRNFFTSTVPFRSYNAFGASVGGPIERDKTFFFGSYEGSRESTAVIDTLNVPLPAWRNGDFSGLCTAGFDTSGVCTNTSQQVKNPYTGEPFANNQITDGMISDVSKKIQSLYFLQPNYGAAGLTTGNYRNLFHPGNNGTTIYDRFDTRIDHNFSSKDTLFGHFNYNRMPIHAYVSHAIPPFGYRTSLRVANSGVLAWTHTFSPSLLNEARFGYARDNNQIKSPVIGSQIIQQLGIEGVATSDIPTYPTFSVSGLTSPGVVPNFGGVTTNFEGTEALNWAHGSHSLKFGFDFIRDRNSSFYYGNDVYGTYNFTSYFTGAAYADFLLGLPRSTSNEIPTPLPHWFGTWWSAYAQDQFKVTRKLTLNYGLRWEAQGPYYDNRGQLYNFNPTTGALVVPTQGLSHVNPQFPASIPIVTASQAGFPEGTLLDSHHAYFYPRVGFAYRPFSDSKTVVRGAYGVYGLATYGSATGYLTGGPFAGGVSYTNGLVGSAAPYTTLFSLPEPFLTSGTTPSQAVDGINPHLGVGYMQQWNLTVERELAGFAFAASYIGTHTVNIPYFRNLNQPQPSTTAFSASELPYPSYISVAWSDNGATDKYNGLQLTARRSYGKNLLVNTGFTWAKDLTNQQDASCFGCASAIQNAYDLAADYGNSSTYPAKSFFAQVVYSLPVGKGQRFLGNASRALDLVAGGWRMAWAVDAHSGFYFTPSFSGFDPSNTNNTSGRPDVVAGVNPYPAQRTINNWLNLAAFKVPGCPDSTPLCSDPANIGRFGNAGVNTLEGPSLADFDLSLMKDFHVAERLTLQFRASATNLFNHPNFGLPDSSISDGAGNYGAISSTAYDLQGQQSRFVDFMLRLIF